jgi:peptide deformylase
MTLLKIAKLGHPVLLARAQPASDLGDPELRRLVADMIETLADARGLGLAAPQVYRSLRVIVVLPLADRETPREIEPLVLLDPELEPCSEAVEEDLEGCLSIPGLRGAVPRWREIAWRARDLDGRPIAGEASGLFARVLQHEVDHLDGILYPSRMRDLRLLATLEESHHLHELMQQPSRPA